MKTLEERRAAREKRREESKLKRIWDILTTVVVCAAVLLAILLAGVRLVGLTPFAVLSGSMEPAYHVGSLIYVKSVDPAQVQVGDPITFVLNEDLVVATHRVVGIDSMNSAFYTKGDANDAADGAPVLYENLLGVPVFTIPYLGYLSNALSTTKGMIIAGTVAAVLLILAFVPDLLKKVDAADKKATKVVPKDQNQPTGGLTDETN